MDHGIELMLLVPHSSHITQPLDVGVFAPLKLAVGRYLNRLLRVGITRLEKAEWVDCFMKARLEALTTKNIHSAWRGSGLFPYNPFKILRHLPDGNNSEAAASSDSVPNTPSTNQLSSSAFSNLQKTPSPFDIQQFTAKLADLAIRNEIDNTPVRQAIPKFMYAIEKTATANILLQKHLEEIEDVVSKRKERKSGKRVVLKDTPHISNTEVLGSLKKCEDKPEKAATSKGRGKKKPEVVPVAAPPESGSESENDKEHDVIDT